MKQMVMLLVLLVWAGAAAATQTMYVNAPYDGFLNLRSGPSTAYHIRARMPHGSRVTIHDHAGKWVELRHESGLTGWAHSGWLSHVRPARATAPRPPLAELETRFVHAPRHGALNLREGPGTAHPVIMTMAHGSRVRLLGAQDDWLFVRHVSGKLGWAHGRYLVERNPRPRHVHTRPRAGHAALRACLGQSGDRLQICLTRVLTQAGGQR